MKEAYDEVVIELTEEESKIAEEYAEYKGLSIDDAFKTAFFEMMDQEAYLYDE